MPVLIPNDPTLDFDVCEGKTCDSFSITETTGVYSSTNNGWGSPNWITTQAQVAYIIVTFPDGTQYSTVAQTGLLYPQLPDDTGTISIDIPITTFGLTGSYPDGIYVITYVVGVSNGNNSSTLTATKTFAFSCSVKCCVDKLISKIPATGCGCDDTNVQNALLAFALYQAFISAAKCGNTSKSDSILARLQRMCGADNCNCNN